MSAPCTSPAGRPISASPVISIGCGPCGPGTVTGSPSWPISRSRRCSRWLARSQGTSSFDRDRRRRPRAGDAPAAAVDVELPVGDHGVVGEEQGGPHQPAAGLGLGLASSPSWKPARGLAMDAGERPTLTCTCLESTGAAGRDRRKVEELTADS